MRVENGRASGDGHGPQDRQAEESRLFTIAHLENKQGMSIVASWEWLLGVSVPSFSPIV
jgi:hypothetical protein